ncbi:hypothetical protein LV779_13240 [Streptomyces thinghirensis]|nr:hypothetical protein [Streptomyces thinghirensis]
MARSALDHRRHLHRDSGAIDRLQRRRRRRVVGRDIKGAGTRAAAPRVGYGILSNAARRRATGDRTSQ